MTTDTRELAGTTLRLHAFVERYTTWMKEVSASARNDPTIAASLADLMKSRLVAELGEFIELEMRLRAFERRGPDAPPLFKLVGNGG